MRKYLRKRMFNAILQNFLFSPNLALLIQRDFSKQNTPAGFSVEFGRSLEENFET